MEIIFCGMGGSAVAGEIIKTLEILHPAPYIHRGFNLPNWVDSKHLIICTSWSGDTEETISSYQTAVDKKLTVMVFTKGGKLAALAKNNSSSLVILPNQSSPARLSVDVMLSAILTALNNSAIIDFNLNDYKDTALDNQVIASLASRIGNKTPLIYSSEQWRYLARFWKINFNENCKLHAFASCLPEAAHNELAGFQATDGAKYFPIVLFDPEDAELNNQKIDKFTKFIGAMGIDSETIILSGKSRLEKILTNNQLAIAVSMELAKNLNVDPLDTSTIEKFKNI